MTDYENEIIKEVEKAVNNFNDQAEFGELSMTWAEKKPNRTKSLSEMDGDWSEELEPEDEK